MRAAAIVGFKKSGKTTLTALVAESLERKGQRVGIIKYSHHGLDKHNTDTFWLMRPGRIVAGCGPDEAAIFWSRPVAAQNLASLMDVDVILAEGGKNNGSWPRILCLREPAEATLLANPGGENPAADEFRLVLATVGAMPETPYGQHFGATSPETADALADLILSRGAELAPASLAPLCAPASIPASPQSPEAQKNSHLFIASENPCSCSDPNGPRGKGAECPCEKMLPQGEISITIGGVPLDMHRFVENIVVGTITGMLRELKGYAPDEEVVIRLRSR